MNSKTRTAYCTNVHPGTSLEAVCRNLDQYSREVRRTLVRNSELNHDAPLGLGLWFSDSVSRELLEGDNLKHFRERLDEDKFLPFTLNGFPQGNFHQKVVKHDVYRPEWWRSERLDYTLRLIRILDSLLPEAEVGSISTLPIAWPNPTITVEEWRMAASNLLSVAERLEELEMRTGRRIVLAIEPEPGCALTDGSSLRRFFEQYLLSGLGDRDRVTRYLTVCHDVCHSAVMNENQAVELAAYRAMNLQIGKVQISSAIQVDWSRRDENKKHSTFESLRSFAEDRYLHQTMIISDNGRSIRLHEDLPALIASIDNPTELEGTWRIHFHVPIFHATIGDLETTRDEIPVCLRELLVAGKPDDAFFTGHFEIETYAWSVLPSSLRRQSLADEIADEFRWFNKLLGLCD